MKLLYSDDAFDFPVEYFLMPEGTEEVSICTITGLLAGPGCPAEVELINKKLMPRKCPGNHVIKDSLASAPLDTQ
jgi:hypothetical protein